MGLKLTSAADYAVRAMIHLSCLPEGGVALRSEIANAQNIPTSFMAKILRSLVRARLLRSSRGVNGGFALALSPSEINMLDIVEAMEPRPDQPSAGALVDSRERAQPAEIAAQLRELMGMAPAQASLQEAQ